MLASETQSSIRDVARLAQVSPGTVSRVLNNRLGKTRVGELTRKRIEEAARSLNYEPNVNAKRLFEKKASAIGLLVPSCKKLGTHIFENRHVVRMMSGIEKGIPSGACELLLVFNDEDFARKGKHLSLFRSRTVDALLVWGAYDDETFWADLESAGYPHLFVGNKPACSPSANFVGADYEKAGRIAAERLLALGHREIAWLGGKRGISLTREQESGIAKALEKSGLALDADACEYGDFQEASGREAFRRLRARRGASAFLAANANMAAGAIKEIRALGLEPGAEISVVACDSVEGEDEGRSEIERVVCDDVSIGEEAAKAALELAASNEVRVKRLIDVRLVAGSSCGAFRGGRS